MRLQDNTNLNQGPTCLVDADCIAALGEDSVCVGAKPDPDPKKQQLGHCTLKDNAGLTTFSTNGGCGGPDVNCLVEASCGATGGLIDATTNECSGCTASTSGTGPCAQLPSNEPSVSDSEIKSCNNNSFSDTNNNACGTMKEILERTNPPTEFTVRVPILDDGGLTPEQCHTFDFSKSWPIAGFARLTVWAVQCSGPGTIVKAPGTPNGCIPPNSDKYIIASLDCDNDQAGAPAGGAFAGVDARRIRLVQ
jgi:hypothetical protein